MKKTGIIFCFLLLGCEPTLEKDSSFEEITEVLSGNYFDNEEKFERMLTFYQNNGELSLEDDLLCSRVHDNTSDETIEHSNAELLEVCKLHKESRTYRASGNKEAWLFMTYDNRENGFINAFSYVHNEAAKEFSECKKDGFMGRKESAICYIPLKDAWYIEYRYLKVPK